VVEATAGKGGFASGLAAGVLAGLVAAGGMMLAADALAPANAVGSAGGVPAWTLAEALDWAYRNLGLSLPVFAVVLALYVRSLSRLRRRVARGASLDSVAHAEQLTDTWTSLFFGVGVIWTAIGMRGALLYALGDPAASVDDGAFAVLQRMVNGGILVALSTTIFGGIGGYLMRVVKTLTVGAPLRRYYEATAGETGVEMLAALARIEAHLAVLAAPAGRKEDGYGQAAVDGLAFPRRG